MHCPRCATLLNKNLYKDTVISFYCPHCYGQLITMSGLRALGVTPENSGNIWQAAKKGKSGESHPCPECGKNMRIVKLDDGAQTFYIDVCVYWHSLWFDFGELEKIPVQISSGEQNDELPREAEELLAVHQVENLNERYDASERYNFFARHFDMADYGNAITRHLVICGLRLLLRMIFKIPL